MADVNQIIIEKAIEYWPVFAGVALMLFGMAKWVIPSAIKLTLDNGGGDAVRKVVKAELLAQDQRIDEKLENQHNRFDKKLEEHKLANRDQLNEIIANHEKLEKITMENMLLNLKNETREIDQKIISSIDDIERRTAFIEQKIRGRKKTRTRS